MQIDEVQLPSSGLSVEVEPLPFERAGHEQQLLEELWRDRTDYSSEESRLQTGDVQVSRRLLLICFSLTNQPVIEVPSSWSPLYRFYGLQGTFLNIQH